MLRVQIPVNGATEDVLVPSCFKTKIETLNGDLIAVPHIEFGYSAQSSKTVYLNLSTKVAISEPAIKLSVSVVCGTLIQREYSLLLDYPESPAYATATKSAIPAVATTELPVLESTQPAEASAVAGAKTSDLAPNNKPTRSKRKHDRTDGSSAAPADVAAVPVTNKAMSPSLNLDVPKKNHKRDDSAPKLKNVLKISNQEATSEYDLKMSQTMTEQSTAPADQVRIQENKLAQARFAALLRGEDPDAASQISTKNDQAKIKKLEAEVEQLKQQSKLKAQQEEKTPPLVIGLILLAVTLLAGLVGAIWMAVRRSRQEKQQAWWDPTTDQKKNVKEIVDSLQSSAEQGNLDPVSIIEHPAQPKVAEINPKNDSIEYPVSNTEPNPKYKRMGLPALEDTNSSTFNFFTARGNSIQIEEISDITQEAEFWMSVNDPQRAIEILEPQGLDDDPSMPITWLYLLDLYRLVKDEQKYTELRRRFKRKFNASIPEFNEEIDPKGLRHLDDFPHLAAKCCALWDSSDILPFLESLLVDDREGARNGFDLPVYRDILFLISICNEIQRTKKLFPVTPSASAAPAAAIASDAPSFNVEPIQTLPDLDVKQNETGEFNEYPNSLNFDLLDFKIEKKEDDK